ncbi:DUF5067 domain-containing protein [Salipaludibacillus agaradhaerens]|jgi:hypothetical protein|uniref:DUF5067 domain-containing protein n=1 Tax=Salipaludibacillus agaradhaerens TaxID=76935 RepID=A0A9Q4AZ32_SALAG|nr:DUF5067 domain-containing protein [Salipaludibacillus agaradhaerens]MCR6095421.1 DUF5067 domain-containing protein [Salipaludibacillus agaradhaerens]MCR6115019.1 DUF5067 domain-containing protein [Salipaludibacillus agaradhaerens]
MKKIVFSLVFGLVSLVLLSACGDDSSNAAQEPATDDVKVEDNEQAENEEETKESNSSDEAAEGSDDIYFKDNEVKINDFQINITETKVIPVGEEGNEYGEKPVFAIWYETTNLSDKEISPSIAWISVFNAIQDNDPNAINELEVGMLPDMDHLDSQMETIKKDGTVENSIAYELDDLETPVTLVAKQGVAGNEIGSQDYEIE